MTRNAAFYFTKLRYYSRAIFSWKSDDIVLASFPKSGNTWVRYFLLNYIWQIEQQKGRVTPEKLEQIMPSFGLPNFFTEWPYRSLPRFVKSHWNYGFYFARPRKILITRDPRDVMVSYFHYVNAKKYLPDFDNFSSFLRSKRFGLEAWFRYHKSWNDKADVVIKYESLKKNDVSQFKFMLETLNIPYNSEKLIEAVALSKFKEFKNVESSFGAANSETKKSGFSFARKGAVGDYKNYFTESDEAYYNSLCHMYKMFY